MEEEKKKMSKETKKLLIIISSFIAVVIIVGVVFGVVFPQLNKKEVQTSSQLENENIQEENTIPDYMELSSDNPYGMRYKMTIDDYVNRYNEIIEETKDLSELFKINKSDFEFIGKVKDNVSSYSYVQYVIGSNQPRFIIALQVEDNSEKIIVVSCIINTKYANKLTQEAQTALFTQDLTRVLMTVNNKLTQEEIFNNIRTTVSSQPHIHFKDNNMFTLTVAQDNDTYSITAIPNGTDDYTANQIAQRVADELDRYYEKLKNNEPIDTSSSTNNSSSTNSTVVADIQDRIDFFNSYYAWNFHPTDEQMQQMVEFANSTSNFTNDTLADFIIDKGWLPDSGTGTVSSNNSSSTTTNNGNSSSSNKNTSSSNTSNKNNSTSSNNSSSKTESEYFNVTVNINMKQIIQNNAIAKKVVDNVKEYPTIHISISDGAGDTGLIYQLENPADYSQGRKSIPDTITRNITTKAGAKIKFVIEMSSSSEENSSNNVAITLLEKEMTFDKTGTYEIK